METTTPQACSRELCQFHGRCVTVNSEPVCECVLGYKGAFCQDRVSESIRVPLTLGVLGVIGGLILLAFTCRFIWKKVKTFRRKAVGTAQMIPLQEIPDRGTYSYKQAL